MDGNGGEGDDDDFGVLEGPGEEIQDLAAAYPVARALNVIVVAGVLMVAVLEEGLRATGRS